MTITTIRIRVELDAYAGNHDSFITGFLFGLDDDRYGCSRGIELHEELPEDFKDAAIDICSELNHSLHDDHDLPYQIDWLENNCLEFEVLDNSEEVADLVLDFVKKININKFNEIIGKNHANIVSIKLVEVSTTISRSSYYYATKEAE